MAAPSPEARNLFSQMTHSSLGSGDKSFPVSPYPPLKLPNALEVFPARMLIYATPFFTFELDTVLRVVLDMSTQEFFRAENPNCLNLLKKMVLAGRGLHVPTETTRKLVIQAFGKVIPRVNLEKLFAGEEWEEVAEPAWENSLLHTGEWADPKLRGICERFVMWEARASEARRFGQSGQKAECEKLVREWFEIGLKHWLSCSESIAPRVILLIETSLDTLADFEMRVHPEEEQLPFTSYFTSLLAPERRPMGNWLAEVTVHSGLQGFYLTKLAKKLAEDGGPEDPVIQPGLLHRWSSSRNVVLPRKAVQPLLAAVEDPDVRDTLRNRYHIARVFTFLCDLIRASSSTPQPSWESVQSSLLNRYEAVFSLSQTRV